MAQSRRASAAQKTVAKTKKSTRFPRVAKSLKPKKPPTERKIPKLQTALDREQVVVLQQRSLIGQLEMRIGKLAFDFVMTDPALFASFQKHLDKKQLGVLKAYLGITPTRLRTPARPNK